MNPADKAPLLYQTHARVHLQNIRANIEGIRLAGGNQRKILIAVKANAYGHGAVEVSRMAQAIGVDWLGVATVPEAIELRAAGITLPILKFSPAFPEEMKAAVDHDLTLPVCDKENCLILNNIASEKNRVINVHLKVDTGMGRIGVLPNEAPELAHFIDSGCPNLNLEGIFTHLPVSDDGDFSYTQSQVENIKSTVGQIESVIGRKIALAHCANSGGVLAHPASWFDMVRPGIMIYGFYPGKTTPHTIPLKPGLSFLTRVSFIKKIKQGTTVGYGRTWSAPQDTWIATIPAGYADGFNRLFSNRGRVLINGRSYPIVGRVCMDQSMVNLGSDTGVRVGDEVVLIGRSAEQEITAYEWAEQLDTITYEVTCQINARVPRIFDSLD
jgi:alanine racemase